MDFPVEMVDIKHPKATQHTMSQTTISQLIHAIGNPLLEAQISTKFEELGYNLDDLEAQLADTDKYADSYKTRFLALKEENQKLKDELFIKTEMKEKMTEENAELYGGMCAASMRVIELDMKLKYKSDAIEQLEGQLEWSKSHLKKVLEQLSVMGESFKKLKEQKEDLESQVNVLE